MIKMILVSQPKPTSEKSPYFDIAREFGIDLVFRPFIKVEGITAKEFRQQKISLLNYTAVVFTSRHAIDNYFKLAKLLRVTIPEDMKYFCVTETIALYIQKYVQYRKRKVFFGSTGNVADLVPTMVKHKTEKYLVPVSDVHNNTLAQLLDAVLAMDEDAVAEGFARVHDRDTSPIFYNNEQALRAVVKSALVAAVDDYARIEELPGGKGFADVAYLPARGSLQPAIIVELKWDKPADTALKQARERRYAEVTRGLDVPVLLVGVSYDPKTKEHACRIELRDV